MARETICKRRSHVLQWRMRSRDTTEQSGSRLRSDSADAPRHSALSKIWLGTLIPLSIMAITLRIPTLSYILATRAARLPGGGGSGTIFLRYRFIVGQRLTYEVIMKGTTTTRLDISFPGHRQSQILSAPIDEKYFISEYVLRVNTAGTATISEEVNSLNASRKHPEKFNALSRTTAIVLVAPDGRQDLIGSTPKGIPSVTTAISGRLPHTAVSLGARWTSVLPILTSPANMTSIYLQEISTGVLSGFGQVGGEPVAIIDETTHAQSKSQAATPASKDNFVKESVTAIERVYFGLASGQLVSSRRQETLTLALHSQKMGSETVTQHVTVVGYTFVQRVRG